MAGSVLIRSGEIIDGTGGPPFTGDVRVTDGVISEIGRGLAPRGERVIDAGGAIVAPGFIDTHSHTDPMLFWNPTLDPEPLHGVTTMLVGNCGLSLYPAPVAARAEICDLFAYAEDVPRHLFDDSVPWTWTDYAGYRDAVNRQGTGPNIAALVGHSQIRIAAMGPDAWTRPSTPAEVAEMVDLLERSLDAGAWGMSLSFYDVDKTGRPIPTRVADLSEFGPLVDAVARHEHAIVELLPGLIHPEPEIAFEYLAKRCGQGGVPLMFNGFVHNQNRPHETQHWLQFVRRMNAEGANVHALMSPRSIDVRVNWQSSMMFMTMPRGWHRYISTPVDQKATLLRDPQWRAVAREEWDRVDSFLFPHRHPELVRFIEVVGEENQQWLGRTLADLIAERSGHPSDLFADFLLANECRPGIVAVGISNRDVDGVAETLADPVVVVSGSDAGAHVQMMCASGDSTLLLTRHVRERGDFTLEWAVHQLTGRQADVFGFSGRGVIAVGTVGDLVVFDLDELHYDADEFVPDLPGGESRLRRPAGGYRATVVSGEPVQLDGVFTGALPGRALSSVG